MMKEVTLGRLGANIPFYMIPKYKRDDNEMGTGCLILEEKEETSG